MALINIASTSPVAIRITDQPPPGKDHSYVATLVGNRDPGAVAGRGITYDVDEGIYAQWSATHPEIASAMTIVTQAEIDAAVAAEGKGYGYEFGLQPPINTAVPYCSQSGALLSCTMGLWISTPSSYSYAWTVDGIETGVTGPDYAVRPEDVGQTATCTVTASNGNGSTTAPPSNSVVVA